MASYLTRFGSAVAGLFALTGCAVLVLISIGPEQRAALFMVPADKAVIYFYRDEAIDSASAPVMYLDGDPLGEPTTIGFWYREVPAGRHTIVIDGGRADTLVLEVEEGHVYFVGEDVNCGLPATPYLHAVREAAGRARMRALVAARKAPPAGITSPVTECGPAIDSAGAVAL